MQPRSDETRPASCALGASAAQAYEVPLSDLLRHCDPLAAWPVGRISLLDISQAIAEGRLEHCPHDLAGQNLLDRGAREYRYHAERIAALLCETDATPIVIDVGVPELAPVDLPGEIVVCDGHHRLAAACLREETTVPVEFSGSEARFRALFPRARRAAG